ncbi:MAG: hypothetical protein LBK71_11490 [Verrucomicrobiales bacterium]|jgi:membrane associated rhomboid family serine protease|nr:hypothetical protein [Verrucomicrobiales bacterium]
MKILRYVIGSLAALFALAHLIALLSKLISGETAGDYTVTVYMAHLVAIAIGLIIAILCFRNKRKPVA